MHNLPTITPEKFNQIHEAIYILLSQDEELTFDDLHDGTLDQTLESFIEQGYTPSEVNKAFQNWMTAEPWKK